MTLARIQGAHASTYEVRAINTAKEFAEAWADGSIQTRSAMMAAWPGGWGWSDPSAIPPPGLFSMQRAGVPVTAHTSLQVDAVHTALRVISNAIIKLGDLLAYTKVVDPKTNLMYREFLADQPDILTNTFGPLFQYDGRRRTIISLGLFGEAFWYVLDRDSRFQLPTAIEVLHPAFMEVKEDKQTGLPIYKYGSGLDMRELPRDNVIHIPFMSMPGGHRGLSAIEYAGVSFALALAAMEYGQRWFSQGASPSFLLSTDQKLGKQEVERIAERFLIEHSGLQSAHLPLVVDNGLKVQKISSTPDEAQYILTLEHARSCIGAWFGIPSHLMGGSQDKGMVWGRTVQEQGFQLVDFTLSGYTVPLEEAHSKLLPAHQYAGFEESVLLRANAADFAAETTALRQFQIATPNDIRVRKLKWAPIDGGDELNIPAATNVAPEQAADVANKVDKKAQAEDNASQNAAMNAGNNQ